MSDGIRSLDDVIDECAAMVLKKLIRGDMRDGMAYAVANVIAWQRQIYEGPDGQEGEKDNTANLATTKDKKPVYLIEGREHSVQDLFLLFQEAVVMEKAESASKTAYRVEWPVANRVQSTWYDSPCEAVTAAMVDHRNRSRSATHSGC